MIYRLAAFFLVLALSAPSHADQAAPTWQLQASGVKASLRGLCVVDANVVWASGTNGTVIRTEDTGKQWRDVSVTEASELDFRDVHAFDARNAIVISAGQPAKVYQTSDGGETWTHRYTHPNKRSFFDALSFWDKKHGIAMSDPVDDRVLLIETRDGGRTWVELPPSRRPLKERGEAGFAASGTNMCVLLDRVYIALGGGEAGQAEPQSRIVYSFDRAKSWHVAQVPIRRGPSRGIFSLAFADIRNGVAVGGDYKDPTEATHNVAITTDGGKTWTRPNGTPPRGFRSCVAVREMGKVVVWVAVGPTGSDYSLDGGQNWKSVSGIGFHAVRFSPDTSSGFAVGADSRVARWFGN